MDVSRRLATNAITICEMASDRIKSFPYYHPQYTLHDQSHMLRVCELMAMVLGESRDAMNPIEVFLVICAAHMHDQGMVPEADEWARIKASRDFQVSLDRWTIENPNLREIRQQLHDTRFSDEEQQLLRSKERELLGV